MKVQEVFTEITLSFQDFGISAFLNKIEPEGQRLLQKFYVLTKIISFMTNEIKMFIKDFSNI